MPFFVAGDAMYELSPQAQAERKRARGELMTMRRIGVLTSDQVRAALVEIDRQLCTRETMRIADGEKNVRVTCADCKREHVMKGSVEYYRCPCTPHGDRSAFIGRETLPD